MNTVRNLRSVFWALIAVCTALSPCFAENWPGFRGPTGQGISQEKNLPLTWNLHENLAWRTAIPGTGWSSPIVWEDRVFLTSTTSEGTSCHLLCLDAANGRIAWDKELFHQAQSRKLAENSHATPTPVTDGKLVYAAFNGGRLVAVDFQGHIAWQWRDEQFVSKHGLAASPILFRDKLIMPFDGNGPADINNIGYLSAWDGAFIVALDKRTGQEKWRAKRGLSRQAHVTPMVIEVNGRPQLISGMATWYRGSTPIPESVFGQFAAWAKALCRRSFTATAWSLRHRAMDRPRSGRCGRTVTARQPRRTLPGSRRPTCR